jgi:hypothetical protein
LSHFLGHVADTLAFQEADSEPSEPGNIFRAETFRDSASVFIEGPVKDIVATVFDDPVQTVITEDLRGGCLLGRFAGDTICDDP